MRIKRLREELIRILEKETIWLVSGETGEYADLIEWNVCAFPNEEYAVQFQKLCQDGANVAKGLSGKDRENYSHPHDPDFYMSYTGATYSVREVPYLKPPPLTQQTLPPTHSPTDQDG